MSPTIRWGLGIGLLIAVIDTGSLFVARAMGPETDNAQIVVTVDLVANVLLYSLIGIRVGRATGQMRTAAEAGVVAGLVAGSVALALTLTMPPATAEERNWRALVEPIALNIALGGVLAMLNGWIASRATAAGTRR